MTTANDQEGVASGIYSGIGGRFVTRAIAAKRSKALFYHQYLSAGVRTVTAKVKGRLRAPTTNYPWTTVTTQLPVEIGIDKAVIISPEFANTIENVDFQLEEHTGRV